MSVLIFIDHADGHIKKSSLEALCYGAKVAELTGTSAEAILLGTVTEDLTSLGKYGVKKVHQAVNEQLNHLDAQVYAKVIAEAVTASNASVVIFSNTVTGKAVAPRLSARLKAGLVAGAIALPDISNGFTVKKTVFSGKAFANISLSTAVKIISINPNSYPVTFGEGTAEVIALNVSVDASKIKVSNTTKASGEVPLTEADIVVSGGRG